MHYLSGPMTGHPNFNKEAFDAAATRLRAQGFSVHSPAEMDHVYGSWEEAIKRPWTEHLARDIAAVPLCEAIVFLPGWEESRGANLEYRIARTFGLELLEYDATATPSVRRFAYDPDGMRRPGDVPAPASEDAAAFSRGEVHAFLAPLAVDVAAGAYDGERWVNYAENPARHVFDSGGIKDNRGKAPINLVPSRPILAVAEILAFGALKYKPHNWRRGLPWPDTYSSLQRHLLAWNEGEDLDPETGKSHLAHAACQLLFLLDYTITGVGEDSDNRFIPCAVEGCDRKLHPTTDHVKEIA